MRKRTAAITAGVAAGVAASALMASAASRIVTRRRRDLQELAPAWDPPPDVLTPVVAFDGTEIDVRAAGDPTAPVLLFAHGFSLDMSTWSRQWPELSAEFRCVLMDHRSHGASAKAATGDLSVGAMGRDIASVLDAVSPDGPAIVVGHSMGAMAILAMAEVRPEMFGSRVVGVALIGAASSGLLRGAMGSVTELLRPRLGTLSAAARRVDRLRRAVLASPADVSGAIARVTQFGPDASQHVVDHVVALAGRASSKVWTQGLGDLMEMDLRAALPKVSVPAIVIVGENDRVTPPAAAVDLVGGLPDGHLVVLEGAGHIAMLERPDQLNRELGGFARRCLAAADSRNNGRRTAEAGNKRKRSTPAKSSEPPGGKHA